MIKFYIRRVVDTADHPPIAEGVIFNDGTAVARFLTSPPFTVFSDNIHDLVESRADSSMFVEYENGTILTSTASHPKAA